MATWGYGEQDGPSNWKKVAPIADGKRQSPINIVTKEAKKDDALAANPLKWKYVPANSKSILNNGHSAQVVVDSAGSSLTGGPLKHKYELAQWHLHWGKTDKTGSEHRMDGEMYAAELHLVHWNTELFKDVGEAAANDQGLCVLGFFLKAGKEHAGLKQMTDTLKNIPYSGNKYDLPAGMDPAQFITVDTSRYYTYLGSLTTPPLFESVTWVVFEQPLEVSEAQLNEFRALYTTDSEKASAPNELGTKIIENYRPPQPVGDRVVSSSF